MRGKNFHSAGGKDIQLEKNICEKSRKFDQNQIMFEEANGSDDKEK